MKIIGLVLIALVLMVPFSGAELNMNVRENTDAFSWLKQKLEVYISDANYVDDPWNTYVNPGQSVTYNVALCNWQPSREYYLVDVLILNSNSVGVDSWSSPGEYINSGACIDYFFTLNAPTTPGTYRVEANSYYTINQIPDDDDYFWLHVNGVVPTPSPTSAPGPVPNPSPAPTVINNVPPVAKITYTDKGNGKLVLAGTQSTDADGTVEKYDWFVDGELKNSQSTFTHVFDQAGSHEIKLVVTDNKGATAEAKLIVGITKTEGGTVTVSHTDDSQTTSPSPEERNGIWFEDGALKVPGFEAVFSILGLLFVVVLVRRKD